MPQQQLWSYFLDEQLLEYKLEDKRRYHLLSIITVISSRCCMCGKRLDLTRARMILCYMIKHLSMNAIKKIEENPERYGSICGVGAGCIKQEDLNRGKHYF